MTAGFNAPPANAYLSCFDVFYFLSFPFRTRERMEK